MYVWTWNEWVWMVGEKTRKTTAWTAKVTSSTATIASERHISILAGQVSLATPLSEFFYVEFSLLIFHSRTYISHEYINVQPMRILHTVRKVHFQPTLCRKMQWEESRMYFVRMQMGKDKTNFAEFAFVKSASETVKGKAKMCGKKIHSTMNLKGINCTVSHINAHKWCWNHIFWCTTILP